MGGNKESNNFYVEGGHVFWKVDTTGHDCLWIVDMASSIFSIDIDYSIDIVRRSYGGLDYNAGMVASPASRTSFLRVARLRFLVLCDRLGARKGSY